MADLSVDAGYIKTYGPVPFGSLFSNAKLAEEATAGKVLWRDVATSVGLGLPVFVIPSATSSNLFASWKNNSTTGNFFLNTNHAWNGQLPTVAKSGVTFDVGVSTTNNQLYFLSPNSGNICPYADLTPGCRIIVIGIGLGNNRFLFRPIDTQMYR